MAAISVLMVEITPRLMTEIARGGCNFLMMLLFFCHHVQALRISMVNWHKDKSQCWVTPMGSELTLSTTYAPDS